MSMQLENVTFTVLGRPLLQDVSLKVNPGEFSIIIGPNGAGKSTALSILAGDMTPSSGRVLLNNHDLASLPAESQALNRGVLPQLTNTGFEFTALDVVLMGRLPHGEAPENPNAIKIAFHMMQQTDVLTLKDRLVTTLSGGERQRVNLARVLAQVYMHEDNSQSPKFLLLDEPISALDPKHQISILRLVRKYAEQGYGVLAVLHDMSMAAMFADVIHIMKNGRITHSGAPQQVMTKQILNDVWQLDYDVTMNGNIPVPMIAFA